ncbi:MAG TPA: iron-containing alcohol dehydrogenase [Opitutaceae bacterium]|nr:iron-containing alcohol dehydrogenase [Opitutaceae bacterium]
MAPFEFATATRIIFGPGCVSELIPAVRSFGRRALLVTGSSPRRGRSVHEALASAEVTVSPFSVAHEPSIDDIAAGVKLARSASVECVIGVGGGSVLDAAKAISALLTNPGEITDYLEVIGKAHPLTQAAVPCIAVPTTAGTGAEVTRNAVLASSAHRVKVSLRSPLMLPRLALVDPELTRDLPPGLTATTGLDALTQLIEPYVSGRANPMTDGLCVEGLKRVARSLRRAVENGGDAAAREDMSLASLFGGLALANAGLGAVHGFAGPIGGAFPAPHGAVCAALLAPVTAANLRALRERAPDSESLPRYAELARLLTGHAAAEADDAVKWIAALVAGLRIPRLSAYGVTATDVSGLIDAARRASSMKANPVTLSPEECGEILFSAL